MRSVLTQHPITATSSPSNLKFDPPRFDHFPKLLGSHSSSPHAHLHHLFHFHACNATTARRGIITNHGGTTTNFGWVVSPILGRHTKPAHTSDRDGGELAHSRDTGFAADAIFLGVHRQADWYVVFHATFASTVRC